MGGIHSGSSAPFEIPITNSGLTYTTTASAADILTNINNCAINYNGSIITPFTYIQSASYSVIMAELTTSSSGYIRNTTFQITVQNDSVDVQFFVADAQPELPAVTASDNGKFLRVVSGAWTAQAVPSAESNSFGGGV